jgi:hypothetical protein
MHLKAVLTDLFLVSDIVKQHMLPAIATGS